MLSNNRCFLFNDCITLHILIYRKDLRRLNSCYQKDIDNVISSLKSWKCHACSDLSTAGSSLSTTNEENDDSSLVFQPIGLISSSFQEKRGTPRQPGICINSSGKITLFHSVFTNPSHALEGLEQFSHMWYVHYLSDIYHNYIIDIVLWIN